MPWTDRPGPRPERSEGELLAAVHRRATVLRRKRRARLSAGLGALAVVLLAAAALARTGDDRTSELRVVGPAPTTSAVTNVTSSAVPAPLPTMTTPDPPPPPSTTRPPATMPPTTRSTLARSPATTAAPPTSPPSTTTTEPPPLPACDPSDVVVTATTDQSTYPAGATVTVLVAAQNRSSRACQPHDPRLEFRNSEGAMVGGTAVVDAFTMGVPGGPRPSWDPGETLSMPMDGGPLCSFGAACPPGTYTAHAAFGPFPAPPAVFELT